MAQFANIQSLHSTLLTGTHCFRLNSAPLGHHAYANKHAFGDVPATSKQCPGNPAYNKLSVSKSTLATFKPESTIEGSAISRHDLLCLQCFTFQSSVLPQKVLTQLMIWTYTCTYYPLEASYTTYVPEISASLYFPANVTLHSVFAEGCL